MKNVSLIINNSAIGYVPPPQPAMQQPPAGALFVQPKIYAVSFSAQFDDEAAAIKFAAELLNKVSGDAE